MEDACWCQLSSCTMMSLSISKMTSLALLYNLPLPVYLYSVMKFGARCNFKFSCCPCVHSSTHYHTHIQYSQ